MTAPIRAPAAVAEQADSGLSAACETETALRRLRWRCRRGLRELDELLLAWWHRLAAPPTAAQCRALERLLDCPDPELLDWLTGRSEPRPADLRAAVHDVRTLLADA